MKMELVNNKQIQNATDSCQTRSVNVVAGPVKTLVEGRKMTEYGWVKLNWNTADAMAQRQAHALRTLAAGRLLSRAKGRKFAHIANCVPCTSGTGGTLTTLRERLLGQD
jgi:hypothetical protein